MDSFALVVGAVNVDVAADYAAEHADETDRPGEVSYGVGGSGYNVAANLAANDVPAALYTVLREESPFAGFLRAAIDEAGIDDRHVRADSDVGESAFVALREEGDVTAAVTSSALEDVDFDPHAVRDAVERSAVVVADCNLTREQLDAVVRAADDAGKPTFLLGVSESKARRALDPPAQVDALFVTETEASAAFDVAPSELGDVKPSEYGFARLVVTRGEDGFLVVTDETTHSYPAPSVERVVTTTGAGDALVSGLCHAMYQSGNGAVSVDDALPVMYAHVRAVLAREETTTGEVVLER